MPPPYDGAGHDVDGDGHEIIHTRHNLEQLERKHREGHAGQPVVADESSVWESVWATMGTLTGGDFLHKIRDGATSLGETLVNAWKNKARPGAEMARATDAFYSRMRTLILYRKEEWPYEYDAWERHHELGR